MKDSYVASVLGWLEACYWHRRKLSKMTDVFISPSRFLKEQLIKGGYDPEQIRVLPNFLPQPVEVCTWKEDYYCYVGRLSPEKGTSTLLEAAVRLSWPLKVIGDGPLLETYREKYRQPHIEFLGRMKPDDLFPIVRKARLLTLPSICYENNPYSVIEALCMGVPTLGSRIGGIPELIEEGVNGFLFTPGNVRELTEKIDESMRFFTNNHPFEKIANDAQNKFGRDTFYKKLITIYDH
jgi:glycosyltransferase involved in cell wall biosynthesis